MTGKANTNERGEPFLGEPGSQEDYDETPSYRGTAAGDIPADFADLAGAALSETVSWRPEDGDMIVGTISDVATGESEYGRYPLVSIDTPDGMTVAVHAFHTILKSEIERRDPQVGDRVAIRYIGRVGPQNMARYTVRVNKATQGHLDI